MAQNFGGRKLWWMAANKHFGRHNIGELAALCSKIARIKLLVDQLLTAKSTKFIYCQNFVLYCTTGNFDERII